MNFDFDDDQEMLRAATRAFLDKRSSLAERRHLLEAPEVFDRSVWEEGAALGWTSAFVPEALGGGSVTAQPIVDLVVLAEEFGRTLQPGPLVATNIVADAIARHGSPAQQAAHLPAIVSGSTVAAWATTADGTADLQAVTTSADVRADGNVVLDGVAGYVHAAAVADLLLVTATAPSGPLLLLVPATAPGLSLRPLHTIDLTRRFAQVRFHQVVATADSVLTRGVTTSAAHERALALATVLGAAEAVGAAEQIFAQTLQYSKDRRQFGRAIGSFQAIKHRMAELAITLDAMRAATHFAALALADGTADAAEAVAPACAYVPEAHAFLCGECLQLTGGIGFTWEHDVHLFLRRARTDEVLYGDPAWHREQLCRAIETTMKELI